MHAGHLTGLMAHEDVGIVYSIPNDREDFLRQPEMTVLSTLVRVGRTMKSLSDAVQGDVSPVAYSEPSSVGTSYVWFDLGWRTLESYHHLFEKKYEVLHPPCEVRSVWTPLEVLTSFRRLGGSDPTLGCPACTRLQSLEVPVRRGEFVWWAGSLLTVEDFLMDFPRFWNDPFRSKVFSDEDPPLHSLKLAGFSIRRFFESLGVRVPTPVSVPPSFPAPTL